MAVHLLGFLLVQIGIKCKNTILIIFLIFCLITYLFCLQKWYHALTLSVLPILIVLIIFLQSFLDCISTASLEALPSTVSTHTHVTPGWNDFAKDLKYKANFWHRVWLEAGSPSSGVLTQIKKKAKYHFKYEVRRLKRREQYIRREKLTSAFSIRNKKKFGSRLSN